MLFALLADAVPWEMLGPSGAAALVTGILVYVLRTNSEQHKECNATLERVTSDFTKAVGAASDRFASATQQILEEARKAHSEREAMLIETLREFRGGPR